MRVRERACNRCGWSPICAECFEGFGWVERGVVHSFFVAVSWRGPARPRAWWVGLWFGTMSQRVFVGKIPRDIRPDIAQGILQAYVNELPETHQGHAFKFASVEVQKQRRHGTKNQGFGWITVHGCTGEPSKQAVLSLFESHARPPRMPLLRFEFSKGSTPFRPEVVREKSAQEKEARAKQLEHQQAHKRRQKQRRREEMIDALKTIVSSLLPHEGRSAGDVVYSKYTDLHGNCLETHNCIEWSKVPGTIDPMSDFFPSPTHVRPKPGVHEDSAKMVDRGQRKRWQIESFYLALREFLKHLKKYALNRTKTKVRVVDFGCGSGALTLTLAHCFPEAEFLGVDMKEASIALMMKRASEVGIKNLTGHVGMIEEYDASDHGTPDVVLALHACGNATDYALLQAEKFGAAYIVSPCCVGKLRFSAMGQRNGGGYEHLDKKHKSNGTLQALPRVSHPRSKWMLELLLSRDSTPSFDVDRIKKEFAMIARAGDISHGTADRSSLHSYPTLAYDCKCLLEFDRSMAMKERGFEYRLSKIVGRADLFAKSDLLWGWPLTWKEQEKS